MLDKYRLTPSATLAITAKAKQLSSLGKKIVSFAAGQPDFDTPLAIKEATKKALDEGFTKYTESSGIPELKKVLVDKLKQKNKLIYEAEQIIVSNGAKQILFEAIMCLADKGDEVIIKAPYWVSYPDMVKVAGGKSVFINDWDDLDKSLSAKTKVLIINSPSNPTGEIIDRSGLEKIAQIIKNYPDLRVLSDECYDCFYYGGQKPVSFASLRQEVYQKTLTINAFSKTFAMTGWRLGYGAGPLELIKAMSALQDQISSNPSSFSQKGALVAWEKAGVSSNNAAGIYQKAETNGGKIKPNSGNKRSVAGWGVLCLGGHQPSNQRRPKFLREIIRRGWGGGDSGNTFWRAGIYSLEFCDVNGTD